ncbi:hypothetical protein, partial [Hymenobacter lapidarius]|uniref:hypothetical protein n=1 Tax=Hymenobacter lapidarius TaxID=1908237 RepID=UPI001959B1FF
MDSTSAAIASRDHGVLLQVNLNSLPAPDATAPSLLRAVALNPTTVRLYFFRKNWTAPQPPLRAA